MMKLISSQLKWLASLILLVVGTFLFGGCTPANQPPVISSLTPSEGWVSPSGSCQVKCIASDPDGDELSYTWSASGDISGEGYIVTWIAPDAPGAYTITVEVTDGRGGEATTQLTIHVVAINHAPVIESLTAEPSPVRQGETSTIECVASDPDGDELSYIWSVDRGNMSGQGSSVVWTAPMTCGSYFITVTVADSRGAEVSEELEVKVLKPG